MKRLGLATHCVLAVAVLTQVVPVFAQESDPVTVLQQYYEARSRGDLAGAMSVVAPDATYTTGPCAPVCVGAADIQQREVGPAMANGGQYTAVNVNVSGNAAVTLQLEVRNKITKQIGIDRFLNDISAEVRDGKIVAYKAALVPTDPQTATYIAFSSSQAASRTATPPSGLSPMLLALLGAASVVIIGLGLAAVVRWRKVARQPVSQTR
jgi:ketosteroid isomerase-like protein